MAENLPSVFNPIKMNEWYLKTFKMYVSFHLADFFSGGGGGGKTGEQILSS